MEVAKKCDKRIECAGLERGRVAEGLCASLMDVLKTKSMSCLSHVGTVKGK
jgi:hypothetical protein